MVPDDGVDALASGDVLRPMALVPEVHNRPINRVPVRVTKHTVVGVPALMHRGTQEGGAGGDVQGASPLDRSRQH